MQLALILSNDEGDSMNKAYSSCLAMTFALCTFAWTSVGESSNPELLATELPLNIVHECETQSTCQGIHEFISRWVSRSSEGSDLFVVHRPSCGSEQCGSWLVEKTPQGPVTRLTLSSRFRFISDNNTHPDVEMQQQVSDIQTVYVYYTWTGNRYVKTETRDAFNVNGVECGTRDQCYAAALKAHRTQHTARALKIWETVHGLSWI